MVLFFVFVAVANYGVRGATGERRHDSPPIISDRGKLQRILTNLLENAVKYTPEGGEVCVAVHTALSQTCIRGSDTGIGIAADEQAKIWQRFYR